MYEKYWGENKKKKQEAIRRRCKKLTLKYNII